MEGKVFLDHPRLSSFPLRLLLFKNRKSTTDKKLMVCGE